MLLALTITLVLISAYALAVSVFAASLYGQQRMMDKMLVNLKRGERREGRRARQYLETLMQKAGTALYRRVQPTPDTEQKPSRRIVTPSMVINRQRDEDAVLPTKLKLEPVPPAIKTPFLRDAASNGAAEK